MKRKTKGFTLVELIVVIAILAILSVALIPIVNNLITKAGVSRVLSDANTMQKALAVVEADIGSFDSLDPGIHQLAIENSLLVKDPTDLPGWNGPYIENPGFHPFGGRYSFTPFDTNINGDAILLRVGLGLNGEALTIPAQELTDLLNLKAVGTATPGADQAKAFSFTNGSNSPEVMVFLIRDAKN